MPKDEREYLVNFQFDVEPGADRDAIAATLREELARVQDVDGLELTTAGTRAIAIDPMTLAAGISVGVLVVKQTTEALHALTALVAAIRKLKGEVKGLKEARLEVGAQVRNLDDLTPSDLQATVEASAL